MKRMFIGLAVGILTWSGLPPLPSLAQQGTGLSPGTAVSVALDNTQYRLNIDPIKIAITLENISGTTVLASRGFTTQPFHLLLTFTDPGGQPIVAQQVGSGVTEGPPPQVLPINGVLVQVDPLETLASTFVLSVTIPDARQFYPLTKAGFYSVKAIVPLRTYAAIFTSVAGVEFAQLDAFNFAGAIESSAVRFALVADADGDGYAFPVPDSRLAGTHPTLVDCDDTNPAVNPGANEIPNNGVDDDCNPATPDVVVAAPGVVQVKVQKHTVGSGNQPDVRKEPLVGVPVQVYEKSAGSCASEFGVSWQHYKSIWFSCVSSVIAMRLTDGDGLANLAVPPGDYLVIGQYDPNVATPGDEIYIGVSVGEVGSGQTLHKFLPVIVRADGSTVPAKYTKKTGSELLIIEPEFIEWAGTQELYPFVFESLGDWTVTTSVSQPPGFVADYQSLTTEVNTTLKSTQFTITDVGSEWVSTGVTHQLTHKGKKETVKSHVGVKLSKKLAQAKGLTRFGKPVKSAK